MPYHNLYDRSPKPSTSAALIGVGHFGTAVLIQSLRHRRLRVAAIADKDLGNIYTAAGKASLSKEQTAECSTAAEAEKAFAEGKLIVTTNPLLLMNLPVDTIVEATGNPEAGAVHALAAVKSGKNIVMVNKETDSCVGPVIKKLAAEQGVVCTPVDGDQHGALMQMVEWARDCGLEVIAAGKSRDAEYITDRQAGTVTLFDDGGITIDTTVVVPLDADGMAAMNDMGTKDPEMVLAERRRLLAALESRGGFDLCEMVIAANATGLRPTNSLLMDPIVRTPEIPRIFSLREDGGVLDQPGVVDVVTCLHDTDEAGLGGGVFLVVSAPDEYSQMILNTKGCISNRTGTAALIYRPYHLCGVEAPTTLLCAGLAGAATDSRVYTQTWDIVQEARIDLEAGEIMGNDHDTRLLTHIVPASPIADGSPIPAHMLNGRKLTARVPKGTIITFGMVEQPGPESTLWSLRKMQDQMR